MGECPHFNLHRARCGDHFPEGRCCLGPKTEELKGIGDPRVGLVWCHMWDAGSAVKPPNPDPDRCWRYHKAHVKALETAGENVATALEVTCRRLGEKNPRKTVPVLAAWDAAKKVGE